MKRDEVERLQFAIFILLNPTQNMAYEIDAATAFDDSQTLMCVCLFELAMQCSLAVLQAQWHIVDTRLSFSGPSTLNTWLNLACRFTRQLENVKLQLGHDALPHPGTLTVADRCGSTWFRVAVEAQAEASRAQRPSRRRATSFQPRFLSLLARCSGGAMRPAGATASATATS